MKRAMILAGGEGTRLWPYTTVLSKPLMPIGGRPVLDIVMRQLRVHGFELVVRVVRARQSDDYRLDIGRHDDYEQAREEFEALRHRLIPAN